MPTRYLIYRMTVELHCRSATSWYISRLKHPNQDLHMQNLFKTHICDFNLQFHSHDCAPTDGCSDKMAAPLMECWQIVIPEVWICNMDCPCRFVRVCHVWHVSRVCGRCCLDCWKMLEAFLQKIFPYPTYSNLQFPGPYVSRIRQHYVVHFQLQNLYHFISWLKQRSFGMF